jgi:hypothetical protein
MEVIKKRSELFLCKQNVWDSRAMKLSALLDYLHFNTPPVAWILRFFRFLWPGHDDHAGNWCLSKQPAGQKHTAKAPGFVDYGLIENRTNVQFEEKHSLAISLFS